MPQRDESDSETDDLSDRDLPREEDMDADPDAPAVEPCPFCKKLISEEAEWCHYCGNCIIRDEQPKPMPLWLLIGFAAAALVLTSWVLLR